MTSANPMPMGTGRRLGTNGRRGYVSVTTRLFGHMSNRA